MKIIVIQKSLVPHEGPKNVLINQKYILGGGEIAVKPTLAICAGVSSYPGKLCRGVILALTFWQGNLTDISQVYPRFFL